LSLKKKQALSFQQRMNVAEVKTQVEQKSFCQTLLGENNQMVNVLPRYNFWGRGTLTFDYFKNVSLEGSTPLSHNSIENNEKAAVAISDVSDTRLMVP